MLENKRVNIVLALIIAIGLWTYVIGNTNPQDEKTFRDIPIHLVNEDVLTGHNLAVLNTSAQVLNVKLEGKRADINRIDAKEIIATVDLADAAKGENQLRVNIKTPDSVDVMDQSLNKVTVVVEDRASKEVDIEPYYEGAFANDEEPITVEMSQNTVTVSGAASLVEQVSAARASVSEGKVTEEMKTVTAELIPLDEEEKVVYHLDLSVEKVQVTTELAKTKTVKLDVPVVDRNAETLKKTTEAPKTITVKGIGSAVSGVETVTAQEIDISDVTEDQTIDIVPILPEGLQISSKSDGTLFLKVKVEDAQAKTFRFETADIVYDGLADGHSVTTDIEEVEITVNGIKYQLDNIEEKDFHLRVDVSGFAVGAHRVTLSVSCEKEYGEIRVSPKEISISIINEEE